MSVVSPIEVLIETSMLQIKIFSLPQNRFKLNLVRSFLFGIKRSLINDFEKFCWFHDPDPKKKTFLSGFTVVSPKPKHANRTGSFP